MPAPHRWRTRPPPSTQSCLRCGSTTCERSSRRRRISSTAKVVVDPSNPVGFDGNGQIFRTLPDEQSAGSIVAALLPAGAHYVKAFGTLAADSLAASANREPHRAALFYATDDDIAATTVERLIRVAGFDPLKAGGVADAGRIEGPSGALSQSGLDGEIIDLEQARSVLAGARTLEAQR